MKKLVVLLSSVIFLSGCATYKFHPGKSPYDKGYVVSRDGYSIAEYTVGKDNAVPADINLAKERFRKRRKTVESYYKKMGLIESRTKMYFWDPPVVLVKFIGGMFRLPFIAISDYKYQHNPAYREKINKKEDEVIAKEETRMKSLKDQLNAYIQREVALENFDLGITAQVTPEKVEEEVKPEQTPEPREPAKVKRAESPVGEIKAVILARPARGFSPLNVRLYGSQSYSKGSKIISYAWDFGDGDTSAKVNPVNTYYSGYFEPKRFTVTLTVQDRKGNTATVSTEIEVLNK